MRTKRLRKNPPWTIEELSAGKWLFTHPSAKFKLITRGNRRATFFKCSRGSRADEMHTIRLEFVNGPCEALTQVMAFLEGWREEWGRQNNRQPLRRDKQ